MSKKKSKRKTPTLPELSADSQRFMDDLQNETERGAALVGAAFLDDTLEGMLRAYLLEDKNLVDRFFNRGALGSFAVRIDLAHLLGLIGPRMHEALDIVRDIRNDFSHGHVSARFDKPRIQRLWGELKMPSAVFDRMCRTLRDRFIMAVVLISAMLLTRAHSVRRVEPGKDFDVKDVVKV